MFKIIYGVPNMSLKHSLNLIETYITYKGRLQKIHGVKRFLDNFKEFFKSSKDFSKINY